MTITTHTAIGAIIGTAVGQPILGFLLGAASHFLVDMIPHGDVFLSDDYRVHNRNHASAYSYAILDTICGIILLVILGQFLPNEVTRAPVYIAAIFGAVLPDILVGITDFMDNKISNAYSKFHFFFHDFIVRRHKDIKLHYSLILQAIFVIGVIFFLG